MDNFRAFRIDEQDGKIVAGFQQLSIDDLTEGNVVVRVTHSTINYKDALAATGKGRILRRYPLNGASTSRAWWSAQRTRIFSRAPMSW